MKSRYTEFSRTAFASAVVAHLLAWAAFGWLLLSASFVEENGWAALLPMFLPVLLTGLALIALCLWTGGRRGIALIVAGMAAALLAFCGLGYLSFGILYSPAALAMIVAAVAVGFRPRSAGSNGG